MPAFAILRKPIFFRLSGNHVLKTAFVLRDGPSAPSPSPLCSPSLRTPVPTTPGFATLALAPDIDAVAHQVAIALLDHVAQMDADAELDATLRRKTRVALDHAILHLDCAANGIDDASELYEDAVTRPLDDAAGMHGDGGIDQIASQRSEAGKCPLLVGPGKLANPTTSAARMAASFRVSAMAVPSPHARLARLLIGLYRLWVQHLIQHLIQHLLGVASAPPYGPLGTSS